MAKDRAGIYIRVLIPVLLLWSLSRMFILGSRLELARQELETARAQAAMLEEENLRLEREIARAEDPELIRRLAEERLGLVMPEDPVIFDEAD